MKRFFGLVASLTAIAGVCAALLAFVDASTRAAIADAAARREKAAVLAVMPEGVADVVALGEGLFAGVSASGERVGYAAKGRDARGYGGEIVLMVGFRADRRTVVRFRKLAASETPGLGMKFERPAFASQFAGKDARTLALRRKGGEIDAIASATVTSAAVCRAVADASKRLLACETPDGM
jgi:electron transport complex protein RnfG